ncbi:ATP-grasp fold amidoligase family protein [Epilithonimonas sp.]|uniref:ATP-grasp fold amidoligase family protein n=1 Tax=Epilithonimonas sp. TaxID=2894511 RepID=UPI002899E800|nr:ATP-grasp fold amidoligase family protein [Epilithonimonas sp.]
MKNTEIKNVLRVIFYPIVLIKREIYNQWLRYLGLHNPKKLASILHYDYCKRIIDWDNPKDLNEKINWLKFNSDTTKWSLLSDKYAVRQYIEDAGFGDLLVKLYGVWSSADDIDFSKLPKSFVLKTTNGSGTVLIVKDKSLINEKEVKIKLQKWLKLKFGIMTAEPHYFSIKPLIIAEELLINDKSDVSTSLIDYKIWCFNGEPHYVWTCSNRKIAAETYVALHDMDWNVYTEKSVFVDHYRKCEANIPKPESLDRMIEACRVLVKDIPQVRLDFYEVGGKAYFGEMTFTSSGGYMDFYTKACLDEMGALVKL